MQIGLTWPLQRLLRTSVPYGDPIEKAFCWDAHCITLHGRSSLLLVHCESRYTCVRFDLSPLDWGRLDEIIWEEIRFGLLEGGIDKATVQTYLADAGTLVRTRTTEDAKSRFSTEPGKMCFPVICSLMTARSVNRH